MTPHLAAVLAARSTIECYPTKDGPTILQAVGRCAILSLAVDNVDEALAFADIIAPIAAAEGLILVADAYHQMTELEHRPRDEDLPRHGDLARMFHDGDPSITEAVLVHSAWRDGRFELTVLPYRRATSDDDEPTIEWLPQGNDSDDVKDIDGRLPDALRAILATGPVFDEDQFMTEDVEGMRMGTVTFMLNRLGTIADLIAREPDGGVDMVDLREAP